MRRIDLGYINIFPLLWGSARHLIARINYVWVVRFPRWKRYIGWAWEEVWLRATEILSSKSIWGLLRWGWRSGSSYWKTILHIVKWAGIEKITGTPLHEQEPELGALYIHEKLCPSSLNTQNAWTASVMRTDSHQLNSPEKHREAYDVCIPLRVATCWSDIQTWACKTLCGSSENQARVSIFYDTKTTCQRTAWEVTLFSLLQTNQDQGTHLEHEEAFSRPGPNPSTNSTYERLQKREASPHVCVSEVVITFSGCLSCVKLISLPTHESTRPKELLLVKLLLLRREVDRDLVHGDGKKKI